MWVILLNIYPYMDFTPSLWSYTKHLISLCSFDKNSISSKITRFGFKYFNHAECLCKWNEKYEVLIYILRIWRNDYSIKKLVLNSCFWICFSRFTKDTLSSQSQQKGCPPGGSYHSDHPCLSFMWPNKLDLFRRRKPTHSGQVTWGVSQYYLLCIKDYCLWHCAIK